MVIRKIGLRRLPGIKGFTAGFRGVLAAIKACKISVEKLILLYMFELCLVLIGIRGAYLHTDSRTLLDVVVVIATVLIFSKIRHPFPPYVRPHWEIWMRKVGSKERRTRTVEEDSRCAGGNNKASPENMRLR